MYDYISGKIVQSSPAHVVIDNGGIGYFINIPLNAYTILKDKKEAQLFVHENIREDAYNFFGFIDMEERELFRQLISVSGIGPNTARMMMSSMQSNEIKTAILTGNVDQLKAIKGIGLKTAQRIIVELKDKLGKEPADQKIFTESNNTVKEEALSAFVMLGFTRAASLKALEKIMQSQPDCKVETLIRLALKML
jgi:Holliday junction DNA helicase RuvA